MPARPAQLGGDQDWVRTGPPAWARLQKPGPSRGHTRGTGREGVKEEGAPPGPGTVSVIPGPLADSAVAAEKCPTAGAGGSAPGSPAPRCPGLAATRGRGRVSAAPSGPGPRPLGAQNRLLPARTSSPRKAPSHLLLLPLVTPLSPLPPGLTGRGLQPGVLPLPVGAHLGGSLCVRSPSPPSGAHLGGGPSAAVSLRCPPGSHPGRGPCAGASPRRLPGLTWLGVPRRGVPRRGGPGGGPPPPALSPPCAGAAPRPFGLTSPAPLAAVPGGCRRAEHWPYAPRP